jgi:hypothetical protein
MGLAVREEIPEITWPRDPDATPDTLAALDLIEFCFVRIVKAEPYDSIASLAMTISISTKMQAVQISGWP